MSKDKEYKDDEQTTDMTTLPPETPNAETRVNSNGATVEIEMEKTCFGLTRKYS